MTISPSSSDSKRTTSGKADIPATAAGALTVDLGAIAENFRRLRAAFLEKPLAAVVKADAYGLGAAQVVPVLVKEGARSIFVAQPDEAIALRPLLDACHPALSLYVLNGLMPGTEAACVEHSLLPVLNSLGEIDAWRAEAGRRGRPLPAAIQVDSGMSRLGLQPADLEILQGAPERLEGIVPTLVMRATWPAPTSRSTPRTPCSSPPFARLSGNCRTLRPRSATLPGSFWAKNTTSIWPVRGLPSMASTRPRQWRIRSFRWSD